MNCDLPPAAAESQARVLPGVLENVPLRTEKRPGASRSGPAGARTAQPGPICPSPAQPVPIRTSLFWRNILSYKPLSFPARRRRVFPPSRRDLPRDSPASQGNGGRAETLAAAEFGANAHPAEAVPGSVRRTRLWFSNNCGAHRAPSTITGDVCRCARKGERILRPRGRTPGRSVSREFAFFPRTSPPRPRPCARKGGPARSPMCPIGRETAARRAAARIFASFRLVFQRVAQVSQRRLENSENFLDNARVHGKDVSRELKLGSAGR